MEALPKVGRFLFALPLGVFGLMHFMRTDDLAGMVPSPGGAIWVYVTGLSLLAATAAILSGKHAVLATRLLGLMLLIFVVSMHLVAVIGGDQMAMSNVLKDTALAGGAFILSGVMASETEGAEAS